MDTAHPGSRRRGLGPRVSKDFAWSFVTQACSSGTNLALTVLAARIMGPSGVGVVYIGFVAYQLILGLHRALVTQPLVADASARDAAERRRLVASSLTLTIAVGLVVTAGLVVAGVLVPGDTGRGLLLFAPWAAFALMQEHLKSVLFQENLAQVAALSDATRLAVFALMVPVAATAESDVAIVGAWGLGYLPGVAVAIVALRPVLTRLRRALTWFWADAWRLGRWLGARELVYQVSMYGTVLALAVIIGTADLGGLRAAETVFSPFSFVAAAFLLPALPGLSRALVESRATALRLAIRISALAMSVSLGYALLMVVLGTWLLTGVFGEDFERYGVLVWPFVVSQLLYASSFAFTVLLYAEQRGRDAFAAGMVLAFAAFTFAVTLSVVAGVQGAAWGLAAAAGVAAAATIGLGWRAPRRAAAGG